MVSTNLERCGGAEGKNEVVPRFLFVLRTGSCTHIHGHFLNSKGIFSGTGPTSCRLICLSGRVHSGEPKLYLAFKQKESNIANEFNRCWKIEKSK